MKLWEKDYEVHKEIEKFTVGNDFILDKALVYYDCVASIAHAKMLNKIGILSQAELRKLVGCLREIISLDKLGKFPIKQSEEDCHTAIENFLTKKLGSVGKKIHTARSRNDQVLTAMRLYEKHELEEIMGLSKGLISSINNKIKASGKIEVPGYTHMQKAMPSSIAMWFSAYVEALKDDLEVLEEAYEVIDKSPLGSAAGFGVPVFNVDRQMTAKLLGFKYVQQAMYCQNSRGKFESLIVNAIVQLMMDLNKAASDLILFSMPEFGYFSLPKELCTGSSIMPQKKNPDVLEIVRARYSVVLGYDAQLKSLYGNLVSGYHRDMQLTKEPLMKSICTAKDCLKITTLVFDGLGINQDMCKKAMSLELYATEEAYKLVKKGMPFRDAYKEIGKKFF